MGKKSKHIFISYAHEDRETAKALEYCLNDAGFEVWWDERLQTGQKWAQEIDLALLKATAVIVLWSKSAVHSDWVKHEASIAKIHNILTHVVIDEVSVPNIFGSIQSSNLSDWNGSSNDPSFLRLLNGIKNTRWQNKMEHWRRTTVVSVTTLFVALILIYGGSELRTYFAGPSPNTVSGWNTFVDHVEIELKLPELRQFYSPEKWDLGFMCRKKGETHTPLNTSFAVMAINKQDNHNDFSIYYHPSLSDDVSLESKIECFVSVIEKTHNLSSLTENKDHSYYGFMWSKKAIWEQISFKQMENMFSQKPFKFGYIAGVVSSCALENKKSKAIQPR